LAKKKRDKKIKQTYARIITIIANKKNSIKKIRTKLEKLKNYRG
jgi:F0F1-type ATP synthase delta subunit